MNICNFRLWLLIIVVALGFVSCSSEKKAEKKITKPESPIFQAPEGGQVLFDGNTFGGWEITNFGTEGHIMVTEGKIVINMGDGASGITWTKDFPTVNYEVNLEARKTVGNDFFCGMTFPVNDDFCSLVVGGWGGPVVGLSCIDGADASDNETEILKRFDKNVWYEIRLRVTEEKITAWIDEEKLIDFSYTGRELTTRPEVDLSKPFGICTWLTSAELKNIWIKRIEN